METESIEIHADSFAKEIARNFILSAAATAGVFTGFVVVALVSDRLNWKRYRVRNK